MDPVPLNVSVRLGSAWSAAAVRIAVQRDVALLVTDLALPADVTVDVSHSPEFGPETFEIFVDGELCTNRPRDYAATGGPAVHRLGQVLSVNRESLLTPAIAGRLWQTWSGSNTPQPATFDVVLRKLAHYRLRTDRVAVLVAGWLDADPAEIVEQALSEAPRRIVIAVHPDTLAGFAPELVDSRELLALMIDGLFYDAGIRVGECILESDTDCDPDTMRIRINDVRTAAIPLIAGAEILVDASPDRLRLLGIEGRVAFNPANGNECAVVPAELRAASVDAGFTTWTPAGYAVLAISAALRADAPALLTREVVTFHLDQLAEAFPVLTAGIRNQPGTTRFAQVLRVLLEDDISIRNLPVIMEAILNVPPRMTTNIDKYIAFGSTYGGVRPALPLREEPSHADAIELAEYVRMSLRRYITHKHVRGQGSLIVYLVDRGIEERLRDAQPLDPAEHQALLAAVGAEVVGLPRLAQTPVLLTTASVRHRLQQTLRHTFPHLEVLSYQELAPDVNIQPVARIEL